MSGSDLPSFEHTTLKAPESTISEAASVNLLNILTLRRFALLLLSPSSSEAASNIPHLQTLARVASC